MIAHGIDPFEICNVPFHGFGPLFHGRGLLLANRQISQELMETLSSKNTTFILVQEDHPLNMPGQPYHEYTAQVTQRAKKLYIDVVTTEDHPAENNFQTCVDTVKRQLNDIVSSLNRHGDRLDSLTVRYTCCFPGEIEDLRVDADGLAAHKEARVIWVMDPRTDKMRSLSHTDMKQIYLHSTTISDALCALNIPVSNFRIFGDLAGPDLARVSRKFGISVPEATKEKLDKYGQRLDKLAEESRNMAANNPGSADIWTDVVRMQEQIFSTRAQAIRNVALYGPSSADPEYERQMALARSI